MDLSCSRTSISRDDDDDDSRFNLRLPVVTTTGESIKATEDDDVALVNSRSSTSHSGMTSQSTGGYGIPSSETDVRRLVARISELYETIEELQEELRNLKLQVANQQESDQKYCDEKLANKDVSWGAALSSSKELLSNCEVEKSRLSLQGSDEAQSVKSNNEEQKEQWLVDQLLSKDVSWKAALDDANARLQSANDKIRQCEMRISDSHSRSVKS